MYDKGWLGSHAVNCLEVNFVVCTIKNGLKVMLWTVLKYLMFCTIRWLGNNVVDCLKVGCTEVGLEILHWTALKWIVLLHGMIVSRRMGQKNHRQGSHGDSDPYLL